MKHTEIRLLFAEPEKFLESLEPSPKEGSKQGSGRRPEVCFLLLHPRACGRIQWQ